VNSDCGYEYLAELELLNFSLDTSNNILTVTLNNLFNDTDDIYPTSITVGLGQCVIDQTSKVVNEDGSYVDFKCK